MDPKSGRDPSSRSNQEAKGKERGPAFGRRLLRYSAHLHEKDEPPVYGIGLFSHN
jgi:hypothetical protein